MRAIQIYGNKKFQENKGLPYSYMLSFFPVEIPQKNLPCTLVKKNVDLFLGGFFNLW